MVPGDPVKDPQIRENRASNLFGQVRTENGVPNSKNHQGFDYAASSGTDVLAVKGGKVVAVQTKDEGDYGRSVTIEITDADGNTRYAFYAHLESVSVTADQEVSEGDVVGKSGTSGNADESSPHLHFENRTEKAPGKGLTGRETPNNIVDTDFTSQDPNATQTTTGVKKTVTNADGTTTTTNMDVTTTTTTTTTAPAATPPNPPAPNTNDDQNRR
jgi:murein DD-endopeptidase MepM/ murein hydrolase activator NlpD